MAKPTASDALIGYVYPTSYGHGPFHPAIRFPSGLYRWPHSFATEQEAYDAACRYMADLQNAMDGVIAGWAITAV